MKIPVASVDISGNEEQYVLEALRSSWISSSGKFLDRFEAEFAQAVGTKFALAVSNGTVALHLAMLGMGIGPGDEVIVPSLTYIATANAVRYVGAEPVFVDVCPHTWCIDPEKIEDAITPRTKGIIAVHLLGHPADMVPINRLAALHGLWVVEDAAEAPFATYRGKTTGGLAKLATFSFFGNKMITCGEGGAVTLDDEQLYTRLKILRGQGMDPTRRYYFPVTGYNFRLTNVAAAILCGQMERREEIIAKRKRIFEAYNDALSKIPGIGLQPVAPWADLSVWMYACTVRESELGMDRDELMQALTQHGIETRPMFIPLHRLPPFREASGRRGEALPVTDELAATGLMLPTFNDLSMDAITQITGRISDIHEWNHRHRQRRVA